MWKNCYNIKGEIEAILGRIVVELWRIDKNFGLESVAMIQLYGEVAKYGINDEMMAVLIERLEAHRKWTEIYDAIANGDEHKAVVAGLPPRCMKIGGAIFNAVKNWRLQYDVIGCRPPKHEMIWIE